MATLLDGMIGEFVKTHPYLAFIMFITLVVMIGYLESRVPGEGARAACITWLFALGIVVFYLFLASPLDVYGPILGVGVLVGGGRWILRYYQKHKKPAR
jgi:hypothetical protein